MSDFENPYRNPEARNIFQDPSVQQAARSHAQSALNDFNPFQAEQGFGYGSQARTNVQGGGGMPNPHGAAMLEPSDPPPYSGVSRPGGGGVGGGSWDAEELRRRQEELDRKAEELHRREQEINAKLSVTGCPIKPCFYQDFSVDIPPEFQKIVKNAYTLWLAYVGLLAINIIGCLTYLIGSSSNGIDNQSGMTFGLSFLYGIIFTPCSFVCWYRPVYKAFKEDSSFNFFLFFFIFFFQLCVCILQFLGIEGWGTVGVINSARMMASGQAGAIVAGVIMLVIGAGFGVLAALDGIVLVRVHRIYRSSGASFAKAQEEFARGVMSNKTVQRTAGNAAASAARSTVQQQGY